MQLITSLKELFQGSNTGVCQLPSGNKMEFKKDNDMIYVAIETKNHDSVMIGIFKSLGFQKVINNEKGILMEISQNYWKNLTVSEIKRILEEEYK